MELADILEHAALVTPSRDGTVQPVLAESWTSSPDRLEWRFRLRDGLVFHDGTPLDAGTAASLLDETRRQGDPGPGFRDVVSVEASADREVVVTLRRPSSLLLSALSFPFENRNGSAAGAFRVVAREENRVRLEAFDRYFRGRPHIDSIELIGYPTPRAAWVALMRHEVDFLYEVPPEAIEFVEASTDVRTFSFLRSYVYLLGFNVSRPVLRDPRVRRALALAVDRRDAVARALDGRAVVATGAVWPQHWAHDRARPEPRHDPEEARALLDAAGWRRTTAERAASRDGRRLVCLLPEGYPTFERLALVLQRQLLDVDVELQLEVLPVAELVRRLVEGRFDAYLFEQRAGPDLMFAYWFWHSSGAIVRSGYSAADAALDGLLRAADEDRVRAAVAAFEAAVTSDPPAIFIAWGERSRAVRRDFFVPHEQGRDILGTLPQWRPATGEASR